MRGCVENAGEVQEVYRNKRMQYKHGRGDYTHGLMKIIPELFIAAERHIKLTSRVFDIILWSFLVSGRLCAI